MVIHFPSERIKLIDNILPTFSLLSVLMKASQMMNLSHQFFLHFQAGKVRKHVTEQEKTEEGLGPNIKSIVTMLMLMLLMMFAVHCTWVTSNAYSSPSVVLASYNHDG